MSKIELGNREYEIVEKIPTGFFVWNIGEYMGSDEYIPLCESLFPDLPKNDDDYYIINRNTLKAIKLGREEINILRHAAHCGIASKSDADLSLRSKIKGYKANEKRKSAIESISIFNRITP